jgi:hypothetical protein
MKTLLFLLTLCAGFAPAAIAGGFTAREATRTLARERGTSWLDRIVQVGGDKGMDQPGAWHIVASNGQGGLQEFFVGTKGIISEGPVPAGAAAALTGPQISQKKWKLDSTIAFTKAEAAAKKAGIGYDSADFRLRSPGSGSTPVWMLQLNNPAGQKVADVIVSADSGKVLNFVAFQPAPPPPPAPPQSNTQQALARTKEAINRGTASLGRGLSKAGGWIRRKFSPEPQPAPVPYYEPSSGVAR